MSRHTRQAAISTVSGAPPLLSCFVGGLDGEWQIDRINGVIGEGLPSATCLAVVECQTLPSRSGGWVLRGTTSNSRYTHRQEATSLTAVQEGLGRPSAVKTALIPIKKSASWWALPQGERRSIFEEQSHHISIGLDYLPEVARRLYHGRDLGELFDFLTWFEYTSELSDAFETLVDRLRATTEWDYVEREVDIRLSRRVPA